MRMRSVLLHVGRRCYLLGLCSLVVWLAVVPPAFAQVSGISYTLTPVADRVYFDKNAGLENGTFLGARLGFGFGEYSELSGLYLVSTGLTTDFSRFVDLGEERRDAFAMLPSRELSTRQYGANLKFNLGRGTIFPFISVGTGILDFDPENLDESRVIYLNGAAGLQFALSDHFGLLVQVQDLVYRYTPSNVLLSETDIADLGLTASDFRQVNVNNFAIRVGLQMYAGGRERGQLSDADWALREQFSSGLSGIRLQVEPIGGVIHFREEVGYRERQRMAGIQAGIDLGPHLGLRGFFWRGVEEGAFTDFDDLQAYGGEVKLMFGSVIGRIVPHLALGGGYLDVLRGYEGNGVIEPVDRPFASGGAGFTLPVTGAIQLHGGVRALLLTTENVEDVNDPSDISANLFYSAGVSFGLGGRGRGDADVEPRRPVMDSPRDAPDFTSTEVQLERLQEQIDSLQASLQRARRLGPGAGTITQTAAETEADLPSDVSTSGERWITVPVPEHGELYVRFGEPGDAAPSGRPGREVIYVDPQNGNVVERPATSSPVVTADPSLTAEDVQVIVRDVMRRELEARGFEARGQEQLVVPQITADGSERRLLDRISELERRLAARETTSPAIILRDDYDRAGYELQSVMPFAGVGFSTDQIGMVGVRADIRSLSLAGARFLPELLVAAGADGVSYGINADAGFPLGFQIASFRPYAGLGLGLVTVDGAELVFNMLAGVEQAGLYGRFFAEYMSQDFFDLNRIVVGYRMSL